LTSCKKTAQGVRVPGDPVVPVVRYLGLDAMSREIVVPTTTFVYQAAVPEEEDRTTEFKTITGGNPAASSFWYDRIDLAEE